MKYFIICVLFLALETPASASITVTKVKEQITALEARPKKTKKDYIAISDLYLKIKNFDKALSNLKIINKKQSIDVLDKISHVYNVMGDNLEEARALELIHVEGKASPSQLTRLGFAYSKMKKTKEAIDSFRESIKKAPKYEKAYQGLYEVYVELKNFYDARLTIIEVNEKFGDKKYWLNEFCRIEIEQNYYDSAKEVCQKAITRDSKNPDNHVYLALAFKQTENVDQARKIIFKAAKQFKKSEVTQWNAGQMSCSIKNWEQASSQFKQCLKADPESGRCQLDIGKTLFELKKYDQGLESMMKSCPYIKGVDVEIRRLSYELEKQNLPKIAKKYNGSTDKCTSMWFEYTKKTKNSQTYTRNTDACFVE
jgi:tetratricopeptide (TPR) repeat protein